MQFDRPLFVYDLETTGTDRQTSRIVSFSCELRDPYGELVHRKHQLINPGVPIPKEASDVHGITDEMVKDKPRFGDLSKAIAAFFDGVIIVGYNNRRFDDVILQRQFKECGIDLDLSGLPCLDVYALFNTLIPRTLEGAVKHFLDEDMDGAHQSDVDAEYTFRVLQAMCKQYNGSVPRKASEINDTLFPVDPSFVDSAGKIIWKNGQAILNFSKHKGQTLQYMASMEAGFLSWIQRNDFDKDLKEICSNALSGKFPQPPKINN